MTKSTDNDSAGRNYVHKCIRALTDHPGEVIYATDIAADIGHTQRAVGDAIRRYIASTDSPLKNDIEIVVPAQAWRYVPNSRTARARRVATSNTNTVDTSVTKRSRPLTHSIRMYFEQNADRIIHLPELMEAMADHDNEVMTPDRVRIGLNNAKISKPEFRDHMITVIPGRAWQYTASASINAIIDPAATQNTMTESSEVKRPVEPTINGDDDDLIIVEKVGDLGNGALLVRDAEKKLYQLTPFKLA